jgi:hypothetical protein
MQNAASKTSTQSSGCNDRYSSIASDLASLIAHVQASMKLIEAAIAREALLGNQETSAGVVVLDDVTPRYVNANAALSTCQAGLGVALHFLMDDKPTRHASNQSGDCRPVRSTSRD